MRQRQTPLTISDALDTRFMVRVLFIVIGAIVGILVGIGLLRTIPSSGGTQSPRELHLPVVPHLGQTPAPHPSYTPVQPNSFPQQQTFLTHLTRILFLLLGLYLMIGQASKPAIAAVGSTIFMTVATLYIGPLIH